MLSFLEYCIYVLSALPYPLAEEFPTVDYLQSFAHFVANGLSYQSLACPWAAVEEDSETLVVALGKSPLPKQYGSTGS